MKNLINKINMLNANVINKLKIANFPQNCNTWVGKLSA